MLTVYYIVMSNCLTGHVAIDSNSECSSACISQLHRTDLSNNTYGCLGILIGYSWVSLHIIHLDFGQFANIISFPPSKTAGFTSVLL